MPIHEVLTEPWIYEGQCGRIELMPKVVLSADKVANSRRIPRPPPRVLTTGEVVPEELIGRLDFSEMGVGAYRSPRAKPPADMGRPVEEIAAEIQAFSAEPLPEEPCPQSNISHIRPALVKVDWPSFGHNVCKEDLIGSYEPWRSDDIPHAAEAAISIIGAHGITCAGHPFASDVWFKWSHGVLLWAKSPYSPSLAAPSELAEIATSNAIALREAKGSGYIPLDSNFWWALTVLNLHYRISLLDLHRYQLSDLTEPAFSMIVIDPIFEMCFHLNQTRAVELYHNELIKRQNIKEKNLGNLVFAGDAIDEIRSFKQRAILAVIYRLNGEMSDKWESCQSRDKAYAIISWQMPNNIKEFESRFPDLPIADHIRAQFGQWLGKHDQRSIKRALEKLETSTLDSDRLLFESADLPPLQEVKRHRAKRVPASAD